MKFFDKTRDNFVNVMLPQTDFYFERIVDGVDSRYILWFDPHVCHHNCPLVTIRKIIDEYPTDVKVDKRKFVHIIY